MSNLVSPPIPKIISRVWAYYDVEVITIVLNTSAQIAVKLYDEQMIFIECVLLIMEGQDYQNWTEDSFLIEWCNSQLHKMNAY